MWRLSTPLGPENELKIPPRFDALFRELKVFQRDKKSSEERLKCWERFMQGFTVFETDAWRNY